MAKTTPWCLWLALCLVACRPESIDRMDSGPQEPPAIAVPTHVLTEADTGTVVEAEIGDWVEVHLAEPEPPRRWKAKSGSGLRIEGSPEGSVRTSELGTRRVFRYLTRQVGRSTLRLELISEEPDDPPGEILEFTVSVR